MMVSLIVFSESDVLLRLVGDFARGLGCPVNPTLAPLARGVQTELPDGDDTLLELLNHVALSATKAGVDLWEPLCRVTYWHPGASAEVAIGLRVAEFNLNKHGPAGA
jgi:hypothetical protein